MQSRREFLKNITAFGALASLPIQFALGAENATKPENEHFVVYRNEILRKKTPRIIDIPDVDGFKVLKGDFHAHTLYSDGLVMPKDRVFEAVDNGLDVLSITDHIEYRPYFGGKSTQLVEKNDDHNISYEIAKPEADKRNLILVRGTEITKSVMPPGHFNALFLQDANQIAAKVDDWRDMLAVAADQGSFLLWNHPGWVAPRSGGLQQGEPMQFFDEHEKARERGHLHGVEVFNSSEFYPIALDWCNERNLVPFANSDIHESEWNTYGYQSTLRPMNLILAKERTHDSVREAFFAGRTIGWAAGMILGRQLWVEKLFRSSVELDIKPDRISMKNKSDIPCDFELDGKTHSLVPKGTLEIARNVGMQKLAVMNWLVGMAQPLEISLS